MKGSAEEGQSGFGLLAVGIALLAALCLIVGLLVVIIEEDDACLPGGEGIAAAPVPVGSKGALRDVRIASWNTLASNSVGRIVAGLTTIGRTADVIGVQELNPESRRKAVARALPEFGFSDGNNSVQILYRKTTTDLIAQGSVKVFGLERMESGVAGTSIGPKSIQWVQLRQKSTGAVFFVVNHHIVPSIENGGRPDSRKPKRIALYQRQMAAATKLVAKLRIIAPVMVTGDFNVDARADARVRDPRWPYMQFGALGLWSSWRALGPPAGGTHGRRLIDYVWMTAATARPNGQAILGKYGSDHSAVVVSFNGVMAGGASPAAPSPAPPQDANAAAPPPPATGALPKVEGMSAAQMQVARTVYVTTLAVGKTEQWPQAHIDRAFVIASSTALKESTMLADPLSQRPDKNVDMGLFGQRTLPGWYGTPEQVLDPAYATRAFLLGVKVTAAGVAAARRNGTEPAGSVGYQIPGLKQVEGWPALTVSQAQHRVQRSAFPNMPPRLEALGNQMLAAFKRSIDPNSVSGAAPAGDPCAGQGAIAGIDTALDCPATGMAGEQGLKPSALYALRCVADKFPQIKNIGGYYATNAGEHPLYRAIDIMIPNYESAEGIALGNQISEWVKANAKPMNVMYVVWRKKIWNVQRDAEGWRQCGTPAAGCYSGNDPSAAHLNHVHVSVYPGEPPGFPKTAQTGGGTGPDAATGGKSWIMPLAAGSYSVGCSMTCYNGHTGQDFPAAVGTNLVSATDGTVLRSEALRSEDGTYRSYGNLIVIRPTGQPRMEIFYAHLSARDVTVGQTVKAGQHIGQTGNTGNSKGPHLHFEVRMGGRPRDPMPILRNQGVRP